MLTHLEALKAEGGHFLDYRKKFTELVSAWAALATQIPSMRFEDAAGGRVEFCYLGRQFVILHDYQTLPGGRSRSVAKLLERDSLDCEKYKPGNSIELDNMGNIRTLDHQQGWGMSIHNDSARALSYLLTKEPEK